MSISQLCISVPLSTSCTDFTVNSKFSANRGSYLQCFSWLKHWTKRFCADFSRSVANRMQVITNKIHQNTLINGMRLFFSLRIGQTFLFKSFRKRFKAEIKYIYSVINAWGDGMWWSRHTSNWRSHTNSCCRSSEFSWVHLHRQFNVTDKCHLFGNVDSTWLRAVQISLIALLPIETWRCSTTKCNTYLFNLSWKRL